VAGSVHSAEGQALELLYVASNLLVIVVWPPFFDSLPSERFDPSLVSARRNSTISITSEDKEFVAGFTELLVDPLGALFELGVSSEDTEVAHFEGIKSVRDVKGFSDLWLIQVLGERCHEKARGRVGHRRIVLAVFEQAREKPGSIFLLGHANFVGLGLTVDVDSLLHPACLFLTLVEPAFAVDIVDVDISESSRGHVLDHVSLTLFGNFLSSPFKFAIIAFSSFNFVLELKAHEAVIVTDFNE
jgi:hypothetical protein